MPRSDTDFMNRALELAAMGAGRVSPNPMVGAVLVSNGDVVGEGYHRFDLLWHAESYAIEQAGNLARGATLYCNLEPCRHHGRTPPCTEALIGAGIARAAVATSDPDPRTNGRGFEQLRAAGITVEVGLGRAAALRLNESYMKFASTGRPFIHAVMVNRATGDASGDAVLTNTGRQRLSASSADAGGIPVWVPSPGLLASASYADALAVCGTGPVNREFLKAFLIRERHRAPLILVPEDQAVEMKAIVDVLGCKHRELTTEAATTAGAGESGSTEGDEKRPVIIPFRDLTRISDELIAVKATSAVLVVTADPDERQLSNADKITLVSARGLDAEAGRKVIEPTQPELQEVTITPTGGFLEITGYPVVR